MIRTHRQQAPRHPHRAMRHPVDTIDRRLQAKVESRHRPVCGPPCARIPDRAHRHRRRRERHAPVCRMQIVSRELHVPFVLCPLQCVRERHAHPGREIRSHTPNPFV
eukprot:6136448-Pleurochrysis_carterae.AAC.2